MHQLSRQCSYFCPTRFLKERPPTAQSPVSWGYHRRYFSYSLVTVLLCGLATVFSDQVVAEASRYPKPRGYVNDFAGVMDQATVQRLETILIDLERKTRAEVAVVTLPSVLDGDIERAAAELFKEWGVGKKGKDNGVLILCAVQNRRVRIEVGYDLEAILPDAKAGQIIREQMVPRFRTDDFSTGLVNGTLAVAAIIAQRDNATLTSAGTPTPVRESNSSWDVFVSLFPAFLLMLFILWAFTYANGWPWGSSSGYWSDSGVDFGGGFSGGFGGFGGGSSGGGGASGSW